MKVVRNFFFYSANDNRKDGNKYENIKAPSCTFFLLPEGKWEVGDTRDSFIWNSTNEIKQKKTTLLNKKRGRKHNKNKWNFIKSRIVCNFLKFIAMFFHRLNIEDVHVLYTQHRITNYDDSVRFASENRLKSTCSTAQHQRYTIMPLLLLLFFSRFQSTTFTYSCAHSKRNSPEE